MIILGYLQNMHYDSRHYYKNIRLGESTFGSFSHPATGQEHNITLAKTNKNTKKSIRKRLKKSNAIIAIYIMSRIRNY